MACVWYFFMCSVSNYCFYSINADMLDLDVFWTSKLVKILNSKKKLSWKFYNLYYIILHTIHILHTYNNNKELYSVGYSV